eukprot:m.255881 g.255881  ORF g.255881 m.255881 type:complete len:69 (-) comp33962_c1_seq1:152-358(-)
METWLPSCFLHGLLCFAIVALIHTSSQPPFISDEFKVVKWELNMHTFRIFVLFLCESGAVFFLVLVCV